MEVHMHNLPDPNQSFVTCMEQVLVYFKEEATENEKSQRDL